MSIKASVIADSISEEGIRLTTVQVTLPKFLLAQLNTHRMFSRNAASSRAIPTSKVIEQVQNNPVLPVYWGKNKPGMQADEETELKGQAILEWELHVGESVSTAKELLEFKVHKQIANRVLEPYLYVDVVITATEWDNFFKLRLHDYTQPEMQEVARCMKESIDNSIVDLLLPGQWHLPYVDKGHECVCDPNVLIKCSVARCARVSYLNHDQSKPDIEKDIKLYELLLKEQHLSPFEHQATPIDYAENSLCDNKGITHLDKSGYLWSNNFKGWIQNRALVCG